MRGRKKKFNAQAYRLTVGPDVRSVFPNDSSPAFKKSYGAASLVADK